MNYIEDEIAAYEARVYPEGMPATNKAVLRKQLEAEDKFWIAEGADFIRGFDDGEPQTVADYNHESDN